MSEGDRAEIIAGPAMDDPDLVNAWRRLAIECENPFLTPDWFQVWLECHPDEEPFAIVLRSGETVRGVLPLVAVRQHGLRLLRFAGARRGDWFTPACAPEDEADMGARCAAALMSERRRWQAIRLDRIPTESAWPGALLAPGSGIAQARRLRRDVLPYIEFDDGGFSAYMAARSRNFRSQIGRRRRRLERDHGLVFTMTSDPAALEADLDTFFRLHDERWQSRGERSSQTEQARLLQRRFAAAALDRGWLRLWIAEADGEPAGAWYGWRLGDRYCYALAGLAERFEPLGLGNVLLAHTIEAAAEEGAAVYDLMWGDEEYKRRFETGRRYAESWIVTRRGHPVGLAAGLLAHVRGRIDGLSPEARGRLSRIGNTVRR